jgi:hypothetical protein
MIRKLIVVLAILTLTTTPALARGGGGGSHGGGGGGFHGGGGGFHGGGGGGFHGGDGGGFHGGGGGGFHGGNGGFHGGDFRRGEFHEGGFRGGAFRGGHERFERFDRFHRFGFFGDFGFVGPAFGFGVYPFFWDPFWFPSPYPAYTYAPPLMIQPEPQVSAQQLTDDPDILVLLRRRQGVLPLHPTVPGWVAQGGPHPGRLTASMFIRAVGAPPDSDGHCARLNSREKGIPCARS